MYIRIGVSGHASFITTKTLENVVLYSKDIQSLNAPHPFFISTLLNSLETAGYSKPYFPKLKTLVISFNEDIRKALRVPVAQPQFFYPSDYEDSDDDASDYEMEVDENDDNNDNNNNVEPIASIDPTQGVYKDFYIPLGTSYGEECLTHNPFNVVDLVRQCSNLVDFTINVKAVGQLEGLNHLLWPGVIPQSIERLEIITPPHWVENRDEDSQDEDYNPDLYPMRDVDEESEDSSDEMKAEEEDGYNEDELVEWYRSALVIPRSPHLWQQGFPELYGSGPKEPLENLRELVLYNTEDVRTVVWWFIEYFCTKLDTFHMINPSYHFCENFSHRRERMNPKFKNLIMDARDDNEDWFDDDESVSCALSGAKWERISMNNCFTYERFGVISISTNHSLRELNLNVNAGSIRSMGIQCILRNVPSLRIFKGRSMYYFARSFGHIPWSCIDKLEVFQCQILFEIPRVDRSIEEPQLIYWTEDIMNMDPWAMDGVWAPDPATVDDLSGVDASYEELQQRVMRNLGRCQNLRELDLSHWTAKNFEIRVPRGVINFAAGLLSRSTRIYGNPSNASPIDRNVIAPWKLKSQKKSLEFTLENGLEELRGLKNLRQLNIEKLNHRISVRELKWMREAWPDLENIHGLFWDPENDDGDGECEDGGKARESKEERRLREEDIRRWLYSGLENYENTSFWRTSELENVKIL
ncbi:hypothetical protein BGZ76_000804 [Entomortierella beljakovae]|nr:hypothetical protein BGZ76_000804 [Entomortierella beljakovae]